MMEIANLKFLDIMRFTGPISLRGWLEAMDVPIHKSFFPYEWFDSVERLDETCLPPIENFKEITLDQHSGLQRVWEEYKFTSFCNFLE